MRKYLIIILIIVLFLPLYSQLTKIDSLETILETSKGKDRFEILIRLSKNNQNINPDKSLEYANEAYSLSTKLGGKEQSQALNCIGMSNNIIGNYNVALESLFKALDLREKTKNEVEISSTLNEIGNVYFNLNDFSKSLEYYNKALDKCDKNKKNNIARTINNIGRIHYYLGNHDKAILSFKQSLTIFKELKDTLSISAALNNLGVLCNVTGKFNEAIEYQLESVGIKEKYNDKAGIATSYLNIGNSYCNLGKYEMSLDYYIKSLKINEELEINKQTSNCLMNIGAVNSLLNRYNKSLEYYFKSLKIFNLLNDEIGLANVYNNIGEVYMQLEMNTNALDNFTKSLTLKEKLGYKKGLTNLYLNIGDLHYFQNNINKALNSYEKSLTINNELDDNYGVCQCLINISSCYLLKNKHKLSEEYLVRALEIADTLDSNEIHRKVHKHLSKLFIQIEDYKNAIMHQELFIAYNDSIYNEESSRQIAEMQTKYETEKKEKQINILQKDNEIQKLKNEKDNLSKWRLFYALLIIFILLIFVYYHYRVKRKLNITLENLVVKRTKELSESEDQYRNLVEQANDGIIILQDLELKFVNNQFANMIGYKLEDVQNVKFTKFFDNSNNINFIKKHKVRLLNKTELSQDELTLIDIKGKEIETELNIKLINYHNNPAELMIVRDITKRKLAEKQLLFSERLAGIGELAAGIAHEIKNPLGNISSSAQILDSEYNLEKSIKSYLDIINRNVDIANDTVKKLIDFSKPHEFILEKGDVNDIIVNTCTLLKSKIRKAKIELTKKTHKLPLLLIDNVQLQGVVLNIILNSINAMPDGGMLTIQTICNKNSNDAKIIFSDTGCGISQTNLKRVFDPFFSTNKEGTGLGLSLAYQVMKHHNGEINISSEEGKGTIVVLTFPVINNKECEDAKK